MNLSKFILIISIIFSILIFKSCAMVSKNKLTIIEKKLDNKYLKKLEIQIFKDINYYRGKIRKKRLKWSKKLYKIAKEYSKYMANNHFFSHIDLYKRDVSQRLLSQGINFSKVAENLAYLEYNKNNKKVYNVYFTSHLIITQWIKSKSHKKIIEDNDFEYISIGIWREKNKIYITSIFYLP